MSYNIRTLLGATKDRWGNPEDNRRMRLLKFGIPLIDGVTFGINTRDGDLFVIQGPQKHRKTTFVANVIRNIAKQLIGNADLPYGICIDTLESGMGVGRYLDFMIAMEATATMLSSFWGQEMPEDPATALDMRGVGKKQLQLSPEYIMYINRTPEQMQALKMAKLNMSSWPINIYGPPVDEGHTRVLAKTIPRWEGLYEAGTRIFALDHLQQVFIPGAVTATQKMERAVPILSNFQVSHPGSVVFLLAQLSITTQRLYAQGVEKRRLAKGGGEAAAEATIVFTTEDLGSSMIIKIEEARRAPMITVEQYLEPNSGLFIGRAKQHVQYKER